MIHPDGLTGESFLRTQSKGLPRMALRMKSEVHPGNVHDSQKDHGHPQSCDIPRDKLVPRYRDPWIESLIIWPHLCPIVGNLQDGVLCDEDAWGRVDTWEEDREDLQADGHQQRRYANLMWGYFKRFCIHLVLTVDWWLEKKSKLTSKTPCWSFWRLLSQEQFLCVYLLYSKHP